MSQVKSHIIIIQFNLILYYLCAESTDTRPITLIIIIIIIIITKFKVN
jgi:hypothetical protein